MPYPPLATVADLETAGVTVDDAEVVSVGYYLAVASAAVREAAGVPISSVTSTVTLPAPDGLWLALPGPPITAVDQVLDADDQEVTGWRLVDHQLWRATGWTAGCASGPSTLTATYTHGLPEVPADIVFLVLRIAAALLQNLRDSDGGSGGLAGDSIRQERIGDYSVTWSDAERISELELPERTRERLAARFGGGADVIRLDRRGVRGLGSGVR